jgi:hypothetical protein
VAGAAAVAVGSWPLLIAPSVLLGGATATTLAARYAGTDLAASHRRARALPVVLWATTAGAITGPNLAEPARCLLGGTDVGPYLLCGVLFALAAIVVHAGLRPDPLLFARTVREPMSMAPVHLAHGGAGLRVVGLIISAHVAAMYATSPLFGRLPILAVGASLLATAGIAAGMSGPHDARRLSWGLRSLGLGWSAVLVSGSAMVVDGTAPADRVRVQGRTDVLLNLSGAVGGAVASATVAVTSYGHLGIAAAAIAAILLAAIALIGQCIRRGNHPSAGQRRTEGDH